MIGKGKIKALKIPKKHLPSASLNLYSFLTEVSLFSEWV